MTGPKARAPMQALARLPRGPELPGARPKKTSHMSRRNDTHLRHQDKRGIGAWCLRKADIQPAYAETMKVTTKAERVTCVDCQRAQG